MIRIVNWLLTRKCNLNCHYCAIVKDYDSKPEDYPDMAYYHKNEMGTQMILNALAKFANHNPDCFHIFYGGEPLLRKDIAEIIEFCHRHAIHYTIISNNTGNVTTLRDALIVNVGKLKGFTASIDPIFINDDVRSSDRYRKSIEGLNSLMQIKDLCDDVVAEITIMNEDIPYIHEAVKRLSHEGINCDVTFVDIAKSEYYDFSNLSDEGNLVEKNEELAYQLMNILSDDTIDVHMKNYLIPAIYKILPSDMDCEIEKDLHNVTIDADGSVRLCLRIRGVLTPTNVGVNDLLDSNGNLNKIAHRLIIQDKENLCERCNHTCQLMSKYLNDKNLDAGALLHLDRR